jgi:ABC-type branched-subunit amino acid transport system substrate-binding protein
VVVVAVVVGGCSALQPEFETCVASQRCQETFGYGWVCGTEGYCKQAAEHPRCQVTYPQDVLQEDPDQAIVFGAVFNNALDSQQARLRAMRLAINEANGNGGLEGRTLGVVLCDVDDSVQAQEKYGDTLSSTEASVQTAAYLAKIGVPAILGPSSSTDVEKAFLAIRSSDTLLMTFSATSVSLTSLDPKVVDDNHPGLLWRTVPPDSLQGEAIVHDMLSSSQSPTDGLRALPAERVAIVYEDGSYGLGLATAVHGQITAVGDPNVYAKLITYGDASQLTQAVGTLAEDSYSAIQEVLFISSRPTEYESFLAQVAANTKLAGKTIFLTDVAATNAVLNSTSIPNKSALFSRVRGTRPVPLPEGQDTAYQAFAAKYTKEYGVSPGMFSFTSHTYDAAWLVLAGAAWSLLREEKVTGSGIARGLRQISSGKSIDLQASSWYQIVESFRAKQSVDLRGTSSELDFDPKTEELTAPIEVWTVEQDGDSWVTKTGYTWPD